MRKRPVGHAMRGGETGGRTAGGRRRARSASTVARSRSSGQGFGQLRGQGTACAELGGGGCGGLARQVGHEPDVDQRLDTQVRSFSSAARGRCSSICGVWPVEIGRLSPLRRAVGGAHEGVDGERSLRPRFAGDPDRRHPYGRGPDPRRGDRGRREGRQTSARPRRGCDRERRDRPGADRQSHRARARSGRAAPVHHRRREGSIQGDPPNLRTRRGDPALSGPQAPMWGSR